MTAIPCPGCGVNLQLPAGVSGPVQCPNCRTVVPVAPPAPLPVARAVRVATAVAPVGYAPQSPPPAASLDFDAPSAPDPSRTPGPHFPPVRFGVKITSDTRDYLYGAYRAVLSPDGLTVLDAGETVFSAPVSTGSRYTGGPTFRVEKGDRVLTFRVTDVSCPAKLAEDAVRFLSGRVKKLDAGRYDNPAWLLAFAPLVLPVGVVLFGLVGGICCGIATGLNAAVARKRGLGVFAKLVMMLVSSLTSLGVSFAVVLFVVVPQVEKWKKQTEEEQLAERRRIAKEQKDAEDALRDRTKKPKPRSTPPDPGPGR